LATRIIAKMPVLMASGNVGQASTTTAKSAPTGSELGKIASDSASRRSGDCCKLLPGIAVRETRSNPSPTATVFYSLLAIGSNDQGAPMLSARNQFQGTIKEIKLGSVMADVVVTVGSIEVVSAITRASAERLALKVGDKVTAVVKSTDVLIDK
jgi:molybdopterin-binding protein